MIEFKAVIKKFGEKGEKTSWHYIEITGDIADQLREGYKKSYRVRGSLDNFKIEKTSLLPMGGGGFIIPLKADMRKALGKRQGAIILAKLEEDKRPVEINPEFMQCLADEPAALTHFNNLAGSHRNYFSKWIDAAKTEETKTQRIARAVNALALKLGYPEMMRISKNDKLI
ncbi:MAG: YdeI/OmpD-associated family protein [Ginsengibacter sp.]